MKPTVLASASSATPTDTPPAATLPEGPRTLLWLPHPETLPARDADLAAATAAMAADGTLLAGFSDPAARAVLRARLTARRPPLSSAAESPGAQQPGGAGTGAAPWRVASPTDQALAEHSEHDRYFVVARTDGDPAWGFVAGVVAAHLAAYEDCLAMGVTLLGAEEWDLLYAGMVALFGGDFPVPPMPTPGWRAGYDPAARWLLGHQLFFTLIQGAIVGLNTFAAAAAGWDGTGAPTAGMARGLELAAAFLRASAASMRYASDFEPADYDAIVRPDMAPPKVRAGFSGFQTRDHSHLVRLLSALKPAFASLDGRVAAHTELVEAVVSAYAAHEFICGRFRGDVLPSLRMAAASGRKTDRAGVEVVRELMRRRLALVDPPPIEARR